jgi:hypothetical protein
MDDDLGLGSRDRLADGHGIEAVDHDWLGAQLVQYRGLARAPGGRRDLVPPRGQLRQDLPPDRPGRPGDEDLHRACLLMGTGPLACERSGL